MAQEPCDPRQVRRQLLSSDMAQNLAFIGSFPGQALTQVLLNAFFRTFMKQVRIHWLLQLVTINKTQGFNFSSLDQLLDKVNRVQYRCLCC